MKSNLWRLDMPSEETKNAYLDRFLKELSDRINDSDDLSPEFKNLLLSEDNLKKLLISDPENLKKLNDKLMKKIQRLKHPPTNEQIEKAFNYIGFLSQKKKNSYWLAKKIGRNTCVYCNRLYIFTVEGDAPNEYITRPVFDHWFPKSVFPLLSMSLCNLIPSCPICNSSLKGNQVFRIKDYIHPYIHKGTEPQITFIVSRTDEPNSEWTLKVDCGNRKKEMNMLRAFGLNEIYSSHGNLEVKDIMNFSSAYPQGYINTLFDIILEDSDHKMSRSDVFRFFFGTEMESDKFLDRPLSKMKYDILKYLGFID